jgi:hypothetical protein
VGKEQQAKNKQLQIDDNCCIKCLDSESKLQRLQNVTSKGIISLIEYSRKIQDDTLLNYLQEWGKNDLEKVKIHRHCQKEVYNTLKRRSSRDGLSTIKVPRIETRNSAEMFAWKSKCFFCETDCVKDVRHPDRDDFVQVETLPFKENILKSCMERKDDWGMKVQRHVLDCHDLVASEARYHKSCYIKFIKLQKIDDLKSPGRPQNIDRNDHFEQLCRWLELEGELYSLSELHEKLKMIAGSGEVYSSKWLKKKLKDKYHEHVIFVEMEGRSNVVCLRNTADFHITDKWYTGRKVDSNEEAMRIIETAAKLILGDIRSKEYDLEFYPGNEDIETLSRGTDWVPPFLRLFLETMIKDPLRQVSIGQSIVNVIRPRSSIPPILFGLGVELDHVFGSKWLLNELSSLGFCVSPEEVLRYKQSVTENETTGDFLSDYLPGSFTQWMADNVDHNVRTIDGKGSLHAMGLACSTTNKDGLVAEKLAPIPRQNRRKAKEVVSGKGIPEKTYIPSEVSGLSMVTFKPILQLQNPFVLPFDVNFDMLWHAAYFFNKNCRPNWSGYMSDVSVGDYPGQSTVSFLPILDMDPSDMTCIFSTLCFFAEQAKKLNIETPVVTFDQPLWLRATEIVRAKSMNVVLILGGFHLMMSYMGSLGFIMRGSGLSEALQQIYGPNAVDHLLSGKAVSRAVRAHLLTESALTTKLLKNLVPQDYVSCTYETAEQDVSPDIQQCREEEFTDGVAGEDENMYENKSGSVTEPQSIVSGENTFTHDEWTEVEFLTRLASRDPNAVHEKLKEAEHIGNILQKFSDEKEKLSISSRTARLWIQHLHYVEVLKLFIRAERTGNWNLHLVALSKMINVFAASGHIHYAKSARIHLQNMLELQITYPWVHKCFASHGYHTVRRSDRYWAGLWSDLIIEQVLMRSLKSRGGITRGRGITESVRLLWVSSMHRCAGLHNAMSNLTGQKHRTSEQHIELGATRVGRDNTDLEKLISWFEIHDPFDPSQTLLKSLSSGLTALDDDGINCDDAENVGLEIQKSLDNKSVADAKIKRSEKVKTLSDLQSGVKLDGKAVSIDPIILFTRLTALIQREEDIESAFYYELTPEPTSIFKDGMMRKVEKSVLRNHLLDKVQPTGIKPTAHCVIDGGALLHKVKWPKCATYQDVIDQYLKYVTTQSYGGFGNICVVFDGYTDEKSTKSHEQIRRSSSAAAHVTISEELNVTMSSNSFLQNDRNKTQLIKLISKHFRGAGYRTVECTGDADISIVKTALDLATKEESVTVIADDTDVLVLLLYHWKTGMGPIYFSAERTEKKIRTRKCWDIGNMVSATSPTPVPVPQHEYLLFAHAWSGCDTTSATYKKGESP